MAAISSEAIRKNRERLDEKRERLLQELSKLKEQETRVNRRAGKAVQERVEKLGISIDDIEVITGAVAIVINEGRQEEAKALAIETFGESPRVTVDDESDGEDEPADGDEEAAYG